LKINFAKSEMVHVGNVDNVDGLTGILGCGVSSLHLKYLGLLLGPLIRPRIFGIMLLIR
jgi:hypothetical protein